jgi:hypothetical protein
MRKCNECGFKAESKKSGFEGNAEELAAMSDHLVGHNPTPAQWTTAHSRMRHAKDLGKACDCEKCA